MHIIKEDLKRKMYLNKIMFFVFTVCFYLLFSLINIGYAETIEFKINDNEKYNIEYEIDGNGAAIVTNTYSTVCYPDSHLGINMDTCYKTLKNRYEQYFYIYAQKGTKIKDECIDVNSKLLLSILSEYVIATGNNISYQLSGNADAMLYKTVSNTAEYGKFSDEDKKTYYDTISESKYAKGDTSNPYNVNMYGSKNSDFLYSQGEKLDDILNDTILVNSLIKNNNIENIENITKVASATNYRLEIDEINSNLNLYFNNNLVKQINFIKDDYERCFSNKILSSDYCIYASDKNLCIGKSTKPLDVLLYNLTFEDGYVFIKNFKANTIDAYKIDNGILNLVASCNRSTSKIEMKTKCNESNKEIKLRYDDDSKEIKIYAESEENVKYIVKLQFTNKYIQDPKTFDMLLAISNNGGTNFSDDISTQKNSLIALVSTTRDLNKSETDVSSTYSIVGPFYTAIYNEWDTYLNIKKFETAEGLIKMGTTSDARLDIDKFYADELSGIPMKHIFASSSFIQEQVKQYTEKNALILGTGYENVLNMDTEQIYITIADFFVSLIRNLKSVILLILFVFIVLIGIVGIAESKNPSSRAEMMEKYKSLLVGTLFFAIAIFIIGLVINYTKDSFDIYDELSEEAKAVILTLSDNVYTEDAKYGFFGALIDLVLEISNFCMEIMNDVFASFLSQSNERINIIELIYNVRDKNGEINKTLPFDTNDVEWTRCMSGYNALLNVAFALMLIAIMKLSIEYIVFAGDEKRIEEVKKAFERMFKASLIIILTPYGVRLLIEFFNYLTSFIPINYTSKSFDFKFEYGPLMTTFMNYLFISTKFKIYFAFMVRKLMISLLLVVTPVIAGIWAISDKFESMNLWLGELITNIAMQFTYALGFMIFMVLSYKGQSNEVGLVLIIISSQLCKFMKNSLQGYFNEWGGIDEEGIGEQLFGKMREAGNKIKGSISKTGRAFEGVSRKFDKEQASSGFRTLGNVGKAMQLKFTSFSTEKDMYASLYNDRRGKVIENDHMMQQSLEAWNTVSATLDPVLANKYNNIIKKYRNDENYTYDDAIKEADDIGNGSIPKALNDYFSYKKEYDKNKKEADFFATKVNRKTVLERIQEFGEKSVEYELNADIGEVARETNFEEAQKQIVEYQERLKNAAKNPSILDDDEYKQKLRGTNSSERFKSLFKAVLQDTGANFGKMGINEIKSDMMKWAKEFSKQRPLDTAELQNLVNDVIKSAAEENNSEFDKYCQKNPAKKFELKLKIDK